jgi:hypothetical protein
VSAWAVRARDVVAASKPSGLALIGVVGLHCLDSKPKIFELIADNPAMDVTSIAAVSSTLSAARTGEAVQMAVLKKALDSQAQSAMSLINALPQVNPPHLGNHIDTTA